MKMLFDHICLQNDLTLVEYSKLNGGDNNEVFMLNTQEGDLVVKVNSLMPYHDMFEAEAKGLDLLASSQSFAIPEVIKVGKFENSIYLITNYVDSTVSKSNFWSYFAESLAKLHNHTHEFFGLSYHNYIGRLPQINHQKSKASAFYITQRLEPQFEMAMEKGFTFSTLENLFKTVEAIIPEEAPSLIHGDLWAGNYLTSEKGYPVLIDPAVCYAPREMDIAMMQLFGGFPSEVFVIYNEMFPMEAQWKSRVKLYQLYYLLVHLNLFGSSYYNQVNDIVRGYS